MYGVDVSVLEKVGASIEPETYHVDHPELPDESYILRIPSAQRVHSNPLLWGPELREEILNCNKHFLRAARELVPGFDELSPKDISEVVVLRGGLGYRLDDAFREVFDSYLPRCFVGARRHRISGDEFEAEISYSNFEPLPKDGVVIIGDTIATGSSLTRTLAEVRSELRKREYGIKKLVVFSAAAAFRGCSELLDWEERFQEWWPDFEIYLFTAEALFGLDAGTHLRYRKPGEAIVPEASKKFVDEAFGDYEEAYIPGNICAVFDWGDRIFKPDRHLRDVLQYADEAQEQAEDEESLEFLRDLEEGARKELEKFEEEIGKTS